VKEVEKPQSSSVSDLHQKHVSKYDQIWVLCHEKLMNFQSAR